MDFGAVSSLEKVSILLVYLYYVADAICLIVFL